MAYSLSIKPIVFFDLDDAIGWYEKKLKGLGSKFLLAFEEAKDRMLANPQAFSFIKYPVRRCRFRKFPYKIIFIVENNTLLILGVYHFRRSNKFLRERMRLFE